MNKDVEAEHVKITRRANGSYVVEDNHTRLGTRLNNQPLQGQAVLKNGDVIKFGTNFVRFNERQRRSAEEAPVVKTAPAGVATAPPPPPAVRKRPAAATPLADQAPPPQRPEPAKPATPWQDHRAAGQPADDRRPRRAHPAAQASRPPSRIGATRPRTDGEAAHLMRALHKGIEHERASCTETPAWIGAD